MFTRHLSYSAKRSLAGSQRGLALVFVLIMMSIATGIALIAARITLLSDRSARNDSDRQVAFQSAELALSDARDDIMSPRIGRGCQFGSATLAPDEGCLGDSVARGVCKNSPTYLPGEDKPMYKKIDWEDSSSSRKYVNYGEFTGRLDSLQVGSFASPAKAPKYIVVDESASVAFWSPGLAVAGGVVTSDSLKTLGSTVTMRAYRVYALGYGASASTQVMLEGVVIKPVLPNQCASS